MREQLQVYRIFQAIFFKHSNLADYVTFQHSQTLADFRYTRHLLLKLAVDHYTLHRSSFGCKPSSDYNVVLLK